MNYPILAWHKLHPWIAEPPAIIIYPESINAQRSKAFYSSAFRSSAWSRFANYVNAKMFIWYQPGNSGEPCQDSGMKL